MNKNRFFGVVILVFLFTGVLYSHENWMDAEAGKGDVITVTISNGHHFPNSKLLLKKRVINYTRVILPGGKKVELATAASGKTRKAEFNAPGEGTYIIVGALKKPPRYFLKTIITKGKGTGTANLNAGEEFEIVPAQLPLKTKTGGKLPLTVLYKGKPVMASLDISIKDKKNFSTYTGNNGIYKLGIRTSGKYLVTATYNGKKSSLVFVVP
ncbi:MAG: DUF4198 domain-containing protein [bacterium]|nr:DUF4198 domain-containing protein [bacterium]